MFDLAQRFGKDVGPVEVSVYFNNFDVSSSDMILEMVPFEGNVLGANFGSFTVC